MKRTLYQIKNEIGTYYVVADDPTQAMCSLEKVFNDNDYGFSDQRKTRSIAVLAEEIGEAPFALGTDKTLLVNG